MTTAAPAAACAGKVATRLKKWPHGSLVTSTRRLPPPTRHQHLAAALLGCRRPIAQARFARSGPVHYMTATCGGATSPTQAAADVERGHVRQEVVADEEAEEAKPKKKKKNNKSKERRVMKKEEEDKSGMFKGMKSFFRISKKE